MPARLAVLADQVAQCQAQAGAMLETGGLPAWKVGLRSGSARLLAGEPVDRATRSDRDFPALTG